MIRLAGHAVAPAVEHLVAVAHMKQDRVVELDSDLAIWSAKVGQSNKLALADSIIYATCRKFNATLWTQDKHLKGLSGVKYFSKPGD